MPIVGQGFGALEPQPDNELVERLGRRGADLWQSQWRELCNEAANCIEAQAREIARLQKVLSVTISDEHEREGRALKQAGAAFSQEIARLREALVRLCNEVTGVLNIAEEAIRESAGNTNLRCLQRRLEEAKAALEKK